MVSPCRPIRGPGLRSPTESECASIARGTAAIGKAAPELSPRRDPRRTTGARNPCIFSFPVTTTQQLNIDMVLTSSQHKVQRCVAILHTCCKMCERKIKQHRVLCHLPPKLRSPIKTLISFFPGNLGFRPRHWSHWIRLKIP